ncbi:MAG: alpha/beta hydrolase [Desulfobacterales bacterium]|nr:alpha/beta hydrolase [Desulfobacterales bacterium]
MTVLSEKTATFLSPDGVKIFYRHYPAKFERGRMVIAHGLGEHSGRYGNVIERMHSQGISVWLPDHRGHGQSEGKRGHILNFTQFLMDLRLAVELAKDDLPEAMRCFLMGHSMGGLMAIYFAQRFPELIDGVIASSPCLGMASEVPAVKAVIGSLMSYIWPGLTMGNGLDATKLSHDPDVFSGYKNDPLVHDRVSARFFTELIAAMESVYQQASKLNVPILLQIAGDDHLVSARCSKKFFNELVLQDKTLHIYEGLYHEIYNELQDHRNRVFTDMENWLEKHLLAISNEK